MSWEELEEIMICVWTTEGSCTHKFSVRSVVLSMDWAAQIMLSVSHLSLL